VRNDHAGRGKAEATHQKVLAADAVGVGEQDAASGAADRLKSRSRTPSATRISGSMDCRAAFNWVSMIRCGGRNSAGSSPCVPIDRRHDATSAEAAGDAIAVSI